MLEVQGIHTTQVFFYHLIQMSCIVPKGQIFLNIEIKNCPIKNVTTAFQPSEQYKMIIGLSTEHEGLVRSWIGSRPGCFLVYAKH